MTVLSVRSRWVQKAENACVWGALVGGVGSLQRFRGKEAVVGCVVGKRRGACRGWGPGRGKGL